MAEEVKLFRTWSSRYALRIVWALKMKSIEYETVFEVLSNKSPLLLQLNPIYKKVPVLVHKDISICESLVILEYIDETWEQVPLLPKDPYEKAMARFWAKFGDEKLLPSIWLSFLNQGTEQEEAMVRALENLKFIEELLKEKKFFSGDKLGFLDIAFGWLANLISIFEEITDLKLVAGERFPLLSAWMQNFSDCPVIKECWPPRDKMLTKYQVIRDEHLAAAAGSN